MTLVRLDVGQALLDARINPLQSIEAFADALDLEWVRRVLQITGTATVRRRKLLAEYVVWLVIGMGLFRDRSIPEVVRHLSLVVPDPKEPSRAATVTASAIVQARDRLGPEPIALLFNETAEKWASTSADKYRWRSLRVYGIDGSTLRVPDTPENDAAFSRPTSGRGGAAYPQARIVTLMVLRSHLLARLVIGASSDAELTLAETLWPQIADFSLVILDRGFISYKIFHDINTQGKERHWLTRAKAKLKWTVVKPLGPGDDLVDLFVNPNLRRKHPDLPETFKVRVIQYQRPGFQPQKLLTSLLDPVAYPAREIVELYHERWELELAYDEIKTHTLEREEALRSQQPERLRQELWGLALGYNLVRLHMERVANALELPPTRLSYRHSLQLIRIFWLTAWVASPGMVPTRLATLNREMELLILPPRRKRQYPRVVKIKMSNYARKRV